MESRKMDNREIIEYYLNELKKMRDEWKAEEGKENEKTIRGVHWYRFSLSHFAWGVAGVASFPVDLGTQVHINITS